MHLRRLSSWWPLLLAALALGLGLLHPGFALGGASSPQRNLPRALTVAALGRRVLVLAPHPDDEVLGAGGAIAQAVRAGADVWVVVATSGESSFSAAEDTLHVAHPTPADFARLGRMRRGESSAGTSVLGLPRSHLIFLGYADGSLTPLWLGFWDCRHPRVSGGTHVARSLLASGFHPHVAYCAPNLLRDLARLLRAVRPDTVILPDLADQHPDHAGLADFAWAAVLAYDRRLPRGAPRPQLLGYLVHYPDWPRDWGFDPTAVEAHPSDWTGGQVVWRRLPLPGAVVALKERALMRYRSQLLVDRPFLEAFVRRDELFTCRALVISLRGRWRALAEIRPLAPTLILIDDTPWPGIAFLSRYAGPPMSLWARSPARGRIELRLSGDEWLQRGSVARLYAWRVSPRGDNRRLWLTAKSGHVIRPRNGVGPGERWRVAGSTLTWSFAAGDMPWQVAASLAGGQARAEFTPWLAVSARGGFGRGEQGQLCSQAMP